jgi:hypothetical protein
MSNGMELEFEDLQRLLAYQFCILELDELEPEPYFQKYQCDIREQLQ